MQIKKIQWWVPLLGLLLFTACQKEASTELPDNTDPGTPPPSGVSQADRMKDTALAYSRDIYLWFDQIPNSFNPRTFSDLNELMVGIRQFSKEPGFANPVDRWSFAIKQNEWDDISSGIAGDFGLTVFFRQDGDLRVRSVEPLSPAGKAGIRRGWRITALNGSSNITVANADAIVDAVYGSTSTSFTFEKPDGSSTTISLNAGTYQEQPVALDTVYTVGSKKVGYLVFNSFLGDTTQIYNRFQEAFNHFSAELVSDLVVDLRYNGGGYVTVQNKLAGYLLPASTNGKLLMKQEYNSTYSQFNSEIKVKKEGSLNLQRIFFIVSDNTASAGELIINNVKPYMEVKLIGPRATYGKPVGYFDIPVGDWYIFPVSSRSTNSLGSGNYFNGFEPDSKVADGLDKDWGDVEESCLKQALRYINTGSFNGRMAGREQDVFVEPSPQVINANDRLTRDDFRGMIDSRKR